MASLISAYLIRGSEETSAPVEELSFRLSLKKYSRTVIEFKIDFDNPLSVSIGDKSDILVLKIE